MWDAQHQAARHADGSDEDEPCRMLVGISMVLTEAVLGLCKWLAPAAFAFALGTEPVWVPVAMVFSGGALIYSGWRIRERSLAEAATAAAAAAAAANQAYMETQTVLNSCEGRLAEAKLLLGPQRLQLLQEVGRILVESIAREAGHMALLLQDFPEEHNAIETNTSIELNRFIEKNRDLVVKLGHMETSTLQVAEALLSLPQRERLAVDNIPRLGLVMERFLNLDTASTAASTSDDEAWVPIDGEPADTEVDQQGNGISPA